MVLLRSGSRVHNSGSGSQQGHSNGQYDDDDDDDDAPVMITTRRGRNVRHKSYVESDPDDYGAADMFDDDDDGHGRHGRSTSQLRRSARKGISKREERDLPDFIVDDEPNGKRRALPKPKPKPDPAKARARRAMQRASRRDTDYEGSEASNDSSFVMDDSHFSDDIEGINADASHDEDGEEDSESKGYRLRQRAPVNYAIPPPLEDILKPPAKPKGARRPYQRKKGPGWSAGGAELGRWMGLAGDDSDSDAPTRTPKKPFGLGVAGGNLIQPDFGATATPSNLGKVTDASLADADPLGVNVNVTFDQVGGLDEHIHSLKEMTLLPLLYPEVFQQFNVTPPRGVLFHGPPGTGKTLLARALAASCRSNGKQISFFMRKGADALSKWVGEAERQLRLLFEEARNSQPSIIFFDEIDGLAPVRSSKQDQIHASIVSTLLALMDGMDGRGQVVVIGATNRPDAVDPALRRPGRFDREFYFPLPKLEAREKILSIMTTSWQGWSGDEGESKIKGLAKMTKGYGGADLRALCTEAALNAVQRKYPQIYKSNDRLLLKPDSISVGLRDFMISIKKLVPSSARSSASVASPLPPQFEPLLSDVLDKAKVVLQRVLPTEKRLTALEEAEFEDEDDEAVALDRELLMQCIYGNHARPSSRILLHGAPGMGQAYIGAALLHHLEGYHVQSLELGTLLGDSTRTVEAAVVQLFVEAKRLQPSIVFIPSLIAWCATVSETARSMVKAMLDTLAPTDPILLLAIIDGQFKDLPPDVRAWFGASKDNRVELCAPTGELRAKFFEALIQDIKRPPNQFLDGVKRRKRVLENDERIMILLKYRLGPILTELKKKYKRFTKKAADEYALDEAPVVQTIQATAEDGDVHIEVQEPVTNGHATPPAVIPATPPIPQLYDMDLERMHAELYKDRYLVPQHFLNDLRKIVHNAEFSLQEFEPQFRMECEKMAMREMKRREDEKKEDKDDDQGKGKAKEPEMFARRVSNPIHGVKRKRSDVQLDGLDTASWDAKRARMLGEVDADASDDDPLDTLGASGIPPSHPPPRLQVPSGSVSNGYGGTPHPSNVNSLLNPTSPNPSLNVYSPTPCNSQSRHPQPSSQQSTLFNCGSVF
ncbi:AAA-domain-containing protein [Hymenopellis radicata]|nr:AAA-domain-containing protein [Hymenopellis radicata]